MQDAEVGQPLASDGSLEGVAPCVSRTTSEDGSVEHRGVFGAKGAVAPCSPVTRQRSKGGIDKTRSTSEAAATGKRSRDPDQRRGKWTPAEEAYAKLIIDHYINGKAPGCVGGESLRGLLAASLRCTPMRITKKFSRTGLVGKSSFKKTGELTACEKVVLNEARAAFFAMDRGDSGEPLSSPEPQSTADHESVQTEWLLGHASESTWGLGLLSDAVDHSLEGGVLEAEAPPPRKKPKPTSPGADALPVAQVPTSVCCYAKEGQSFVRVVAPNDIALMSAIFAVLHRFRLGLVNCRVDVNNGVAHARVTVVDDASKCGLARSTLEALEQALKHALVALPSKQQQHHQRHLARPTVPRAAPPTVRPAAPPTAALLELRAAKPFTARVVAQNTHLAAKPKPTPSPSPTLKPFAPVVAAQNRPLSLKLHGRDGRDVDRPNATCPDHRFAQRPSRDGRSRDGRKSEPYALHHVHLKSHESYGAPPPTSSARADDDDDFFKVKEPPKMVPLTPEQLQNVLSTTLGYSYK